jgi:hypothetical protein
MAYKIFKEHYIDNNAFEEYFKLKEEQRKI